MDHTLLAPVHVQRYFFDALAALEVEDGCGEVMADSLLLQALPPGAPHTHRWTQRHELHR